MTPFTLGCLCIPCIAFLMGAQHWFVLRRTTLSALQHFGAGIVFAALAIELLPLALHDHTVWIVSLGFFSGVASMLALKWWSGLKWVGDTQWLAYFIDFIIDGMLIVLALSSGLHRGVMVTFAVTFELFFLGLSLPKQASKFKWRMASGVCIGGLVIGLSQPLFSPTVMGFLLSFGCAALLFLVAEELLVQAHHDVEDGPWLTAMLFVGFWAICVLDMLQY